MIIQNAANENTVGKDYEEAGEMAQQLREPADLLENLSSIPGPTW